MKIRLAGVYAKLDRADEHFKTVQSMLADYYANDFNNVFVDFDIEHRLRYRGSIPSVPVPLLPIVGDCIHNLRSALDHLANELVRLYGGIPDENTTFPVLKVPPTANQAGISPPPYISCLDTTAAAQPLALIAGMQPYVWGHEYAIHPLWVLHRLWIQDKHRGLIEHPAWIRNVHFKADGNRRLLFSGTFRFKHITNDGAAFDFVPDPGAMDVEGEATLAVALGVGLPWEGTPAIEALRDLSQLAREEIVGNLADFF